MADKPSKTIYHSHLVRLGPVQVEMKKGPQASKYKNKPEYVALMIDDGETGLRERFYDCENESCADFFRQFKDGESIVICATGSRDDAAIDLDDSEPQQRQEPQKRQPDKSQAEHDNRKGGQASPAPAREARTRKPASTQPPAGQTSPAGKQAPPHAPVFGATVGMAVNNAVGIVREIGIDPLKPDFYRLVHEIASDIIRVALALETGHLVPKISERLAKKEAAE